MSIGITEKEQNIIIDILKEYKDYSFYFYGSRIKGTWEKTSDLDILIKGRQEVPLCIIDDLKQKFDDSNLPYIVNFSDYYLINKDFYKRIEKDLFPYDWKEYKIGDLCSRVTSGGTPKSTNAEYYVGGTIPWLNTKEVRFNRIYLTEKFITELGLNNSSAKWITANNVIVAMYGATAGNVAINKIPLTTNQACCNLEIDATKADYNFIYYYLLKNYNVLSSMANGGAQQNLNSLQIKDFDILLPPLETQRKIARVLGAIDDKIELNNSINKNLEQQAQAIFKSWFIDFEPFNGTMPNDWKEGVLGDFIEIKRGGSPRPIQDYISDTGYRWLKISDATSIQSPFILNIKEHIKESGLNKTVLLKAGSLVLSNSATPGIPKILDVDSCIHDGWLYFPNSKLSNEYLYLLFQFIRPNIVALGNGSVFTNLKTDILKNYETILPNKDILYKFNSVVGQMFQQILNNTRENERLTQLRDTLLPKLMNGEIDVDKVEV